VMTWTDSGGDVVPGTTYEYRVQVTDGFGNFANSAWTSITVSGGAATPSYLASVLASEPDSLWRFDEAGGATVAGDLAGWRPATVPASGVTLNQPGVSGTGGTAAQFGGATGNFVRSEVHELPPHEMSLEAWFQAAPTANGGLIAGFNNSNTASSGAGSPSGHDRNIYMDTTGRVHFGANPTTPVTVSDGVDYRDGAWHHVVGSVGPSGLAIYVDGVLVDQDPTVLWARTGYYGYVRIGGGALNGFPNTNTSTGRWFDGAIDEVALYKSTLTALEVEAHYEATGRTANVGNAAPTASFTTSINPGDGLTATFDAAASTDTDGNIVDYSWNFGDGSPVVAGAGTTANHVFAEGTYTVTLTVTDDDGATDQEAAQVVAPGANDAPVAAFSTRIVGRDVTFDAAGSTDPDGTIAQYQWNFGDGTPVATTASPTLTRTYAATGSFSVTLTVTDDRGATAQRVQSLSTNNLPTPPPPGSSTVAADTFTRTVANGLGSADIGGAWTISGGTAASYAVNGSTGRVTLGARAAGRSMFLSSVARANAMMLTDISFDKAATGGGIYASAIGRRVGTGEYRATVRAQANGTVQALLVRRIGTTETNLAVAATVPGLTHVAGQTYTVRFEVTGVNPTQLRMKVWLAGTAEPGAWLLSATDSTAAMQAAGSVGINTYLSGSATNAPVVTSIDNLTVVDPTVGAAAPPTARFAVETALLSAELDATIAVDDGTITAWAWNFGDGATSPVGPVANHVYAAPGTYAVSLTVTDNQGLTNQLTLNVTVNA
jgi:PKD repeat protein